MPTKCKLTYNQFRVGDQFQVAPGIYEKIASISLIPKKRALLFFRSNNARVVKIGETYSALRDFTAHEHYASQVQRGDHIQIEPDEFTPAFVAVVSNIFFEMNLIQIMWVDPQNPRTNGCLQLAPTGVVTLAPAIARGRTS